MRRTARRPLRLALAAFMALAALPACQGPGAFGGSPASAPQALGRRPGAYDAGSVLVKWKTGADAGQVRAAVSKLGLASRRELPALGAAALAVPAGAGVEASIASLRRTGLVAWAEPNWVLKLPARQASAAAVRALDLSIDPVDPIMGAQRSWGQAKIGVDKVWPSFRGSSKVVVAVIDTGVDLDHPDLRPVLVPGYTTFAESGPQDYEGHGTHVAGIVAGLGLGDPGVRGVAPGCRVMPVKVMGPRGREGKVENVVAGLLWAVDHGAKVVNMSLGDEGTSSLLREAVLYAQARDVLVVAASGNLDETRHKTANTMNYPAAYPGVMAVGATDDQDKLADFSFWGQWLSVTAPGVDIHSSVPGDGSLDAREQGDYQSEQGTSMAAPFVAGVAGLVRSRFPALTAAQVKQRIEASAHDLGDPGYDPKFGHGRIDAYRAVLGN